MSDDNVKHCLSEAVFYIETASLLIDETRGLKARKHLYNDFNEAKCIATQKTSMAICFLIRALSVHFKKRIFPFVDQIENDLVRLNKTLEDNKLPKLEIANTHLIPIGDRCVVKKEVADIDLEELKVFIESVQITLKQAEGYIK